MVNSFFKYLLVVKMFCVSALLETHCCVATGWDQYADLVLQNLGVNFNYFPLFCANGI